jgi:hypothetical protein
LALGLPFLILAGLAEVLRRQPAPGRPWFALEIFALAGGVGAWLGSATLPTADADGLRVLHWLITAGASIAMVEFGRRGSPLVNCGGPACWMYGLVAGVAALLAWFGGANGMEAACRYALALPGGVLAAMSLGRTTPEHATQERIGLRLAAGAFAAYAAAVVFAIPLVPALCVLAAVTGLTVYCRGQQSQTKPLNTMRWRLFFLADLALAVAMVATAFVGPQAGADETVQSARLANAPAVAVGTDTIGRVESGTRPAAWGDLLSQRQRRGGAVIVGAVLATVCLVAVGHAVNRRNSKPARARSRG